MITVVHIITGLNTGGAERSLFNVIRGGLHESNDTIVVSMTDEGRYGPMFRELGIPVYCLGMKRGFPDVSGFLKLKGIIRAKQPDVLQGWMYHGNLLAGIASVFSPRQVKVIWNVRHCLYDIKDEKLLTQWVIRLCVKFSRKCSSIIYNSELSKSQHEQVGFSKTASLVIPNGFDLRCFRHSSNAKREVRRELGIPQDAVVVGNVGRFHPMKDHACFLAAAKIAASKDENMIFLLVGTNVGPENIDLTCLISDAHKNRIFLIGERSDMARLYNVMDMFCLSSSSEAFPNVLGEAMSSGLPCITTNVGDASYIVGETGFVVPPRNPQALADAMGIVSNKATKDRVAIGKIARQRIEEKFSLATVVESYESLYEVAVRTA